MQNGKCCCFLSDINFCGKFPNGKMKYSTCLQKTTGVGIRILMFYLDMTIFEAKTTSQSILKTFALFISLLQ